MPLAEYKAKRDFRRTREPPGRTRTARRTRQLSFVVQKHDATRLHYDFRLEMDGVLKSWAVPKGFPTAKGDRRLAVQVEDHPIEYAAFEGTIPQGSYGAGTVMVWDHGTYEVSGDNPASALDQGKIHLFLSGKKLKGEWTLVRMRPSAADSKPQWLLLKSGVDIAPFSKRAQDQSAVTGRTLAQIAAAEHKVEWESDRTSAAAEPARPITAKPHARERLMVVKKGTAASSPQLASLPRAVPAFCEPMKARLTATMPKGAEWIYEIKFDGVRAIAVKHREHVQLYSRAENDLTLKYPGLADAVRAIAAEDAVLDGEIVALDEKGRSSFQLLQSYHQAISKPPLVYYIFDALNLHGRDLRSLPLLERKRLANDALQGTPPAVRFSTAIEAESERVIREMESHGLEGLIAKKANSRYEPGQRSGAWLKYKWSQQQEFVIGGFTAPQGARAHFGALLVGYYADSELLFAGKVGTGFTTRTLASLSKTLQPLIIKNCPFANLPEKSAGRYGKGLTATQMRQCTWVEPSLVCQVRFAEWTRDDHLRQPSYLGLREDKRPREVVREIPA